MSTQLQYRLPNLSVACFDIGVWPHVVLSGHAHNYQRFTRPLGSRQIPFYVAGNGGHGLAKLNINSTLRTPIPMPSFAQPERNDSVTLNSYDFKSYGYLRIVVNAKLLHIEYHPASDSTDTKTPDDSVTIDLATGTLTPQTIQG